MIRFFVIFPVLFLGLALLPSQAFACATGCSVFDVSTSGVLPGKPGSTVWLEHSYTNQDRNMRSASNAPASQNHHKKIRTNTALAGVQYMFNREWGMRATLPFMDRNVVDNETGADESFQHQGIGDIRLTGIYSGFSPDMSTGLTFGVKLPTGKTDHNGFDSDVALGTGSTDLSLGGYHIGQFHDPLYGWFVNGVWDQPVLTRSNYHPGAEINATIGAYYKGWRFHDIGITPVMQMLGNHHFEDNGIGSHEDDSGYTRFMAAPGIEVNFGTSKIYTEIAVPVYQYVRGNQLTAPVTVKTVLSYNF